MVEESSAENLARRYLLGELGEQEELELEQQMIESGEVQERIALVETELIDAYLAGRLPPQARARFEARYLSHAGGVHKVEHARLLERWAASGTGGRRGSAPLRQRPWRAAAAALFVAGLAGFLSWQVWQGHRELAGKEAEIAAGRQRERALESRLRTTEERLAEVRRQLQAERTAAARPIPRPPRETLRQLSEVSLLLTAGAVRGGEEAQTLPVPAAARSVRLDLAWPVARETGYRAAIETPDRVEVWRAERLEAGTQGAASVLTLRLPASLLPPGDYILRLEARDRGADWESVADYSFRVTAAP